MRHSALLTMSLLSLCALAQSEPATFIPQSPLDPAGTRRHTYRESDIVAAFPELRGDRKLSVCSNSIMSGATEIVFLADARENQVIVKAVQCTRVDKGLSCGSVHQDKQYFLESPEHSFSLKNLTLAKARTIVEAWKANRITGFPEGFGASHLDVKSVEALPDGRYRLDVGDVFCAGCAGRFDVRLDTSGSEPRLVVLGNADLRCF